jgi:hypothetical protein
MLYSCCTLQRQSPARVASSGALMYTSPATPPIPAWPCPGMPCLLPQAPSPGLFYCGRRVTPRRWRVNSVRPRVRPPRGATPEPRPARIGAGFQTQCAAPMPHIRWPTAGAAAPCAGRVPPVSCRAANSSACGDPSKVAPLGRRRRGKGHDLSCFHGGETRPIPSFTKFFAGAKPYSARVGTSTTSCLLPHEGSTVHGVSPATSARA